MKRISAKRLTFLAAIAGSMMLAATVAPFEAHAQTQYGTIVLLSGQHNVHLAIDGRTCSASGSGNGTWAIVVAGDGRCSCWTTSSTIPWPLDLKVTPDEVLFQSGGRSYVIHDAATVRRAQDIFAPVHDMLQRQSDFGRGMNLLSAQARLSARQDDAVRVSVPDMSTDFEKAEADAKRLSVEGGTQSELSELQSELSELQSRISEIQSQASEAKSRLSEQRSDLSNRMSAMSEEMKVMSRQMSAVSTEGRQAAEQAARQAKVLLDQAISSGVAQPE